MRIFGIIPPPGWEEHRRVRIWAAGALAGLVLLMLMLLIGSRSPEDTDLAPPALRTAQLTVFRDDVGACRAAITDAGYATAPAPDLHAGRGCGYENAVEITQSEHAYSAPLVTTCAAAAALILWERDVVRPAAERYLGQSVSRIELAGPAYSCRPIAGRSDGRMSEHASANAVDIGGFTLADGASISVERDWRGTPAERAFLRAVRDGACERFAVVLSPDYNRAHRDHLHFDLSPYEVCD